MNSKTIKEKYDKFAKNYDLKSLLLEWFLLRKLRKRLLGTVEGNILEVGIGTGKSLKFYPHTARLNAVDLSPGMLNIAQKKALELGLQINCQVMNVEKLAFPNESFDAVVDFLGLCTFENPIKALQEMSRVCRKGGRIILLEHGVSNISFIRILQNLSKNRHYKKLGCHLDRNPIFLAGQTELKPSRVKRHFFGIFYEIEILNR